MESLVQKDIHFSTGNQYCPKYLCKITPSGVKSVGLDVLSSCELLSILYLCMVKHNNSSNLWDGVSKYKLRDEFETILQRGTSFRITKIEKVNNYLYIDVEVVAQI
ncbi:MAG: hypothetical protein IJ748_04345 [Bacteroidales bacterium]|nr:hypothetical protein [Bacteroidales bacterium]